MDAEEIFEFLVYRLNQKIRPIVIEAVNEAFSKQQSKETVQPEEELLSPTETMQYLKVSRSTLFSWKKTKLIKGYRIGRKVYYKKSELLSLFKGRKDKF